MTIVNDLAEAKRSRDQDKVESNRFYDEQAHSLAQWQWGEKPPEGLILGDIPQVNLKQIRLDPD